MKIIAYLSGREGFDTLQLLLKYASQVEVVLPKGKNNEKLVVYCRDGGIPIFLRDVREVNPSLDLSIYDYLFCNAFPFKIYEEEFLQLRKAAYNLHSAILPTYRGAHGGSWALINGEGKVGVTMHQIDKGFDTGKVAAIYTSEINDSDWLPDIQEKLLKAKSNLIHDFFNDDLEKAPVVTTSCYWRKRSPADSHLNWHLCSDKVFQFVRAVSRPGIFAFNHVGNRRVEIKKVAKVDNSELDILLPENTLPGTVCITGTKTYALTGEKQLVEILDYVSQQNLKEGDILH